MNAVDVVVAAVVGIAGVRGFWRGFLRELFGLLAIGAGILAAVLWSGLLAERLTGTVPGPDILRDAAAFAAVFVAAHIAVNLFGLLLDRLAGALLLGGVNRGVGLLFGAAKGAAVVAVVLLAAHVFRPVPAVDEQIMSSTMGRPLVAAASAVLRFGLPPQADPASQG